MHPHITDQLTATLRRSALEFCRDHAIPPAQTQRFADAFMVAALTTMRWQNEHHTLHTVALAEAIDCQPCIRDHLSRSQSSQSSHALPQEARP